MITGVHALLYAEDPAAARAFFRDVLEWPWVEDSPTQAGWLIFRSGPSEIGVHPTDGPAHHTISLMCDDLEATMAQLRARGAEFAGEPHEAGWGIVAEILVPGLGPLAIYEPRHAIAKDL
jgi:predicted enzyme related to lactoylglutathione lyase